MPTKINIRLAEKKDVAEILEIYAPFILKTPTSFEREVPSIEGFWGRIQKILPESPWLVCEIDGKIAGYAYADEHRSRWAYQWNREVSVYLHPDFRRRNIASALYHVIFEIIKHQGYCNAIAGITLPNEASVGFHQKWGFKLVGIYHNIGFKFGKWWDVGWWEMPLVEEGTAPKSIKGLSEILGTIFWEKVIDDGILKISQNLK